MRRFLAPFLALAVMLGMTVTDAAAQTATSVTIPADLMPVGLINKILTDYSAQILALVGFSFVAGLIGATVALVMKKFSKKGGSVVR